MEDLKKRLGEIIIGYNRSGEPVKASDLKAQGAMAALLKDAIKPNLVQTLEYTPCFIHGICSQTSHTAVTVYKLQSLL